MENSFSSIINQSNSILILLPKNPYFDEVASGLGLYLALRGKKDVSVVCPTDMTVEFNRLIGVNKISSEVGNKNMVMKFSDYDGNGIERVSADLDDGIFYLTVIPKPGVSSPRKENVKFGYSGVSCDTAILIGGVNESHFPSFSSKDLDGVKLIHFGIKPLKLENREIVSFDHPATSISEIVAAYLLSIIMPSNQGGTIPDPKNVVVTVDADVSTNLLVGIEEGSQGFSSPQTTSETFQTIADLMRLGGQRMKPDVNPNQFPKGAIPESSKPKSEENSSQVSEDLSQPQIQTKQSDQDRNPTQEWLKPPKVFKGTSIN